MPTSATQPLLCRRLRSRRRHDPEQQGSAPIAPTSTQMHDFLTLTGMSHVRLANNSTLTHLHLFLRPAPSPLLCPVVVPPIQPIQQHTSPPLRPTWRPPLSSCRPHQDHTYTGYTVRPPSPMTPFRLLTSPTLIAMHPSLLTATNIVLALTWNLDAHAMHNNTTKNCEGPHRHRMRQRQ